MLLSVARRHNEIVLNVYNLLKSGQIESCILTSKQWIDSFPILQRDINHEKEMQGMSFNELFKHCSTNYDETKENKGITEGERFKILRERSYGVPVRYMNGSGVLFLMIAISYRRVNDYENSLKWKTHASQSGAFYDGVDYGPAEIWRIIDLSTISELRALNRNSEIEYIKSRINEGDISYIYVPRDYMGSNPLGDMFNILRSMEHYHGTIDYDQEYYRVYTKDDELVRKFNTDGLMAIVDDMINTIRKNPSSIDDHFEMYCEEMDIPQMN